MMTDDALASLEAELYGVPDYDADPAAVEIDREGAERHLAHIARLDAALAADQALYDAQRLRLDQWMSERRAAHGEASHWHWLVLRRFHEAALKLDRRLKTIKLPHGELRMRVQQPSWIFDGVTFLAWATVHAPELVREPPPSLPAVDMRAAKAIFHVEHIDGQVVVVNPFTGERPPGVVVEEQPPKFSVVVAGDEPEEDQ